MANVRINTNNSSKIWGGLVALLALAGGAWFLTQSDAQAPAPQAAAPSEPRGSNPLTAAEPAPVLSATSQAQLAQAFAEVEAVTQAVKAQPLIAPVQGRVAAKPDFLSQVEWDMLQSVAMQHPNPDQQLNNLVNAVRFNKQLDAWQALPATAPPAQRQSLAQALLDDIPQRVQNEDMDMTEATKLQLALLADLEPQATARTARAATEAKRLKAPASAPTGGK